MRNILSMQSQSSVRPIARLNARELSQREILSVSGGEDSEESTSGLCTRSLLTQDGDARCGDIALD